MNSPTPDAVLALIDSTGELRVRVVPGAKVEKLAIENQVLKVWIRTAPEDGKANKAVIAMLAGYLSIPNSNIEIVKGHTYRDKRLRITLF